MRLLELTYNYVVCYYKRISEKLNIDMGKDLKIYMLEMYVSVVTNENIELTTKIDYK